MSKKKGLLHTCDRCGATKFTSFLSSDIEGKKEPPGREHFRGEEYEAASGWSYAADIGDLCPNCASFYKEMMEKFKQGREPVKVNLDMGRVCVPEMMTPEEITERDLRLGNWDITHTEKGSQFIYREEGSK